MDFGQIFGPLLDIVISPRLMGLTRLAIPIGVFPGAKQGRLPDDPIIRSKRGPLQGAQFHAVAGRVCEATVARGLGRPIPQEWLLQTVRN